MPKENQYISDHDTLVALKTSFDIFIQQYSLDMAELKDGTTSKLADHELRLNILEKTVDQWKTSANTFRVIGGLIGGLIVFLLIQIPSILRSLGVIK